MMNPFAFCQPKQVEIRGEGVPTRAVSAWCFRDFALYQGSGIIPLDAWRVSHLPTGLLLARFPDQESACAAMIEVAELRNDWAIARAGDLSAEMVKRCEEIIARHRGALPVVSRLAYEVRYDLNGYGNAPAGSLDERQQI